MYNSNDISHGFIFILTNEIVSSAEEETDKFWGGRADNLLTERMQ